jgi:hypothetical protein
MNRSAAFDTLDRIRDELDAGRFALSRVLADLNNNPDLFMAARANGVSDSELRRCAANLQITFVLRLFAEFEAVLRHYWVHGIGRHTEPEMRALMESIARRRSMNADDLALAHQIREYRNDIIHENLRDARFDFPQCLRGLGRFLRWLPLQW